MGLLLLRALRRQSGASIAQWQWRPASLALLLVVLYAATDEFHQLFVPNRQASVIDVLIDSTGAFIGLLVAWIVSKWLQSRQSRVLDAN